MPRKSAPPKPTADQVVRARAAAARLTALGWTFSEGRWRRPGAWATPTANGIEARGITAEEREVFDVIWESFVGKDAQE